MVRMRKSPVNQGRFSRGTMPNCARFMWLIASRWWRATRKIRKRFAAIACGVCVINAFNVPSISRARVSAPRREEV